MHDSRRDFLKKAGVAAGGATVLGASTASAATFQLGEVVHTTTDLNVRDGAGTDYTVIDTVPAAMRGTVKDGPAYADGYEWWYVEFDDDRYDGTATGWCAKGDGWLSSGKEWTSKFCRYDAVHATDYVNIRDSPSTSGTDIGTTEPGDWGTVLAGPEQNDGYTWWKVEFYDDENGWVAQNWLEEGMLYGCNSAWDTDSNQWELAKVVMSEASVGNTTERRAVGYTVLNRMERNGTTEVSDEWDAYAHNQDPTDEIYDLAGAILTCSEPDPSCGATHFYSPRSMPKEGDDTTGCACGGGLEWTPGLDERNYCPSWSETMCRSYVVDARQAYYKFYRSWGDGAI
ncbi:SH3 domain-containing protein [Halorussus ruber]|uniref:SH3 domain-containing protein n=1 Tax=Halorussus ruber TaxID=1126238 RepID=UPI0010930408|nr:SH3 domain-containing protein [Halorussus ruber]